MAGTTNDGFRTIGKNLSYCVRDVIHHGVFGSVVFKGLKDGTQPVALLSLELDYIKDKSVSWIEGELINKVTEDHQNVLRFSLAVTDKHFLYIATDIRFVSGCLVDLVKGNYRGPVIGNKQEILRQVTNGLSHLHRMGMVHQNIIPPSILVCQSTNDKKPLIKLADYGLCRILEDNTKSELFDEFQPHGTRGWSAPELFEIDCKIDFKVDIFELGLIFAYTLTGGKIHPFGKFLPDFEIWGKKPMSLRPSDLQPPYMDDVSAFELIASMLNMDPEKRPTTERVLHDDFFSRNFTEDNGSYFPDQVIDGSNTSKIPSSSTVCITSFEEMKTIWVTRK